METPGATLGNFKAPSELSEPLTRTEPMLVLRPSPTHGVGVFTTAPIRQGEHLRLWQPDDWRFVSYDDSERYPELRQLRDTYCVDLGTGYSCPLDFHRMSIGWYMNHSDAPNVGYSREEKTYEYFALRDIAADEEILCDYRTLSPAEAAPAG